MTPAPPLRIGFLGLPLAALLLERDGHRIEWAALSPVTAPGRRRLARILPPERIVDLFLVGSAWQTSLDDCVARAPVDLVVSWYFTRRIESRWIEQAPLGGIGAHPSLLPKYRGPDPFYAVVDAGEPETGVTVHRLAAEYDRGGILTQVRLSVAGRNAWQLARAIDRPSLRALREVVRAFSLGHPPRTVEQDEGEVTWAPQPEGQALRVDWSWSTERVLRRIRALSPIPGLLLELGGVHFAVLAAEPTDDYPAALDPGEAHIGQRLVLRTIDGAIAVEKACLELADEEPILLDGARLAELLRP